MSDEFITLTPVRSFFERASIAHQQSQRELAAASRIGAFISENGIPSMERLNSLTEAEILAIPSIGKTEYRHIKETLDYFRAEYGNLTWKMPDFTDLELGYIFHIATYRKLTFYYDIVFALLELAHEKNRHPLRDLLMVIHIKLYSITRDEFLAIAAESNICPDNFEIK